MIDLIRKRVAEYGAANQVEEEHAIKEILQSIALYGLWRSGFFEAAGFQGGTSLRILHGMQRFSEDLDFILKNNDPNFSWSVYLKGMVECFEEFGLRSDVLDKSRMDQRIKKAIVKDNSLCHQLNLLFYRGSHGKVQKIKLEIDTDPPDGSGFDYTYLDFPLDFEVCHQDLSSNFALKIHALLCRPYVKGRDWYDFNWYIKQGVKVNLNHLKAALHQWGPWAGQDKNIDIDQLQQLLCRKIVDIDWKDAAEDVKRFLKPMELPSLGLWSEKFFINKIKHVAK